ncbi:major royal jelly protein 3-like [Bemisia tabaci]|uniref:major royal jelly protein 3-like n=1 Tax=Bemisia tabaci TaxID=7038 RepID=UPI003B282B5B
MTSRILTLILVSVPWATTTDIEPNLLADTLGRDPRLQVIHLYEDEFPTGIAVSASGRKFSCYPSGLDPATTYTGSNNVYQVAELTGFDTETAYPNASLSQPPGGAIARGKTPVTKGLSNYLLSVQSVVIDFDDVLWLLDTGRVIDPMTSTRLLASPGGTKLISIDLSTDDVTKTNLFPPSVAKPSSYFNDVRFDTGRRYAYITDSGEENAIVVLNLATGESYRALAGDRTVTSIFGTVPFVAGEPLYDAKTFGFITNGVDGIALSPKLDTLYYTSIAGRFLYSIPTALLRDRASDNELASAVRVLGEVGISDGLATDSNGVVYAGNAEQCGVSMFDPETGMVVLFVRDKRILWVDTFSVGADGYLYFTSNQVNYLEEFYPGEGVPRDRRKRPFVLFRAKLPRAATKGPGS